MKSDMTTPAISEADSCESVSKTDRVTLDLSKRNKIVIYAKPRGVTNKNVTAGHSIFSRRLEKGAQRAGSQGGTPIANVNLGQPRPSSKQSTMSNFSATGGHLERLAKEQEPIQPAQTTSPTTFASKRQTPTKYAAECANCPCSFQGLPPCQRCRLLLLADRFCNLVDTQCEKWKAEPRC